VILCLMSDEEAGSDYGAEFLVSEHPELFAGVRYAIGEFGGFTMQLAGRRFYPVMVAEKQVCWTRATLRGRAGHGSLPISGGAMGKLSRLLGSLDRRRLPVHVTPVARGMVEAIAAEVPAALGLPLRGAAEAPAHGPPPGCLRRPGQGLRPAAAQHGQRKRRAGRREDQRDPRRGLGAARLPSAAGLRPRAAVRGAACAGGRGDGAGGHPPRSRRRGARPGAVRHAGGHAARAGPGGQADSAAAACGDRRALLLQAGNPDLRLSAPCSFPRTWPSWT
jgi:hypothetical protein